MKPFFEPNNSSQEIYEEVKKVLDSGKYILGERVKAFESDFAEKVGAKYGIGVSNGTDALYLSLRALSIGPGDTVLTTPYTFVATAEVIERVGAKVVFSDIGDDFNLDIKNIDVPIETRALITVHLFGKFCPVSEAFGLPIIEDCAQSFGTKTGRGLLKTFSFFPSKNLSCAGDGGMVVCDKKEYADRMMRLRSHGASSRYVYEELGGNYRLDEIQAAILSVKLRYVEEDLTLRRKNADMYTDAFRGKIETPNHKDHSFNQYVIRVERRDELYEYLRLHNIETMIYFPKPLHLQKCFSHLGYKEGDFPNSERASREALALPIYPARHIEEVIERVKEFYGR